MEQFRHATSAPPLATCQFQLPLLNTVVINHCFDAAVANDQTALCSTDVPTFSLQHGDTMNLSPISLYACVPWKLLCMYHYST